MNDTGAQFTVALQSFVKSLIGCIKIDNLYSFVKKYYKNGCGKLKRGNDSAHCSSSKFREISKASG